MNLLEIYSNFTPSISLTSLLNNTSLTSFMLVILLELLIQSNHHLLSKGIPCWNQQSSTMKIRQSGHLKRFWIHNIQNQIIIFNTKFADLIVILILSDIMQIAINFRIYWKLYMNIICNILTNQICSLLNQNWFIINQPGQAERKSETWFQKLFQTHYSVLTESSFQKHSFWALRTKLMLKMESNVEGDFSLKQHLPHWGNITAVVFLKWLKLNVINCTHSTLTSFKIRLTYDSSLKSLKPCQGFTETLLRF